MNEPKHETCRDCARTLTLYDTETLCRDCRSDRWAAKHHARYLVRTYTNRRQRRHPAL